MITETFFNYQNRRWLWANLLVLAILIAWYWIDMPIGGRNGGTVVGYTLGGVATAGILTLMWYGIRKRSYHAKNTTLKGSLALHVWLGLMLSVLVPFHCAFQFGLSVHTLAYVVMMIVVISGLWGAVKYVELAPEIGSHRGGGVLKKLVEQMHITTQNIDALCQSKSDTLLHLRNKIDVEFVANKASSYNYSAIESDQAGALIAALPATEKQDGLSLLSLIQKKRELITKIANEVSVMKSLRLWLYLHLPLSLALVVVLAIHIFSVFYYRG